jgi:hypothetical protein
VPDDPLNVVVGFVFNTKLPPIPLTIDQAPVPKPGALAARVALGLHKFWSGPALAVVGGASN